MDSQNRLIIYRNKSTYLDLDLASLGSNFVLFTFLESDEIELEKIGTDFEILLEVGEDISPSQSIYLEEKKKINSKNEPHSPLPYQIIITNKKNNHSYYRYYEIKPLKAMEGHFYSNLISYISSKNEEIIYDSSKIKSATNLYSSSFCFTHFLAAGRYLFDNFSNILYCVYQIKNNLSSNLCKKIVTNKELKKQNNHTIVKNIEKFDNQSFKNIVYINDYNNLDNIKLLNSLPFISKSISNILNELQKKKELLLNSLKNLEKYNTQNKYDNQIKNCNDDIFYVNNQYAHLNQINNELHDLYKLLLSKNVSGNHYEFRCFDSNLYKHFCDLVISPLLDTYAFTLGGLFTNHYALCVKKTSLLFEYYCFYIILEVIKSLGFMPMFNESDITLESGSKYQFKFDIYEIEIVYDLELKKCEEFDVPGVYSVNSRKNRPDFIINFFVNGTFKKTTIIDAKCRAFSAIRKDVYKPNGQYRDTLYDYMSLQYMATKKIQSTSFNKVIFLLPSIDNLSLDDEFTASSIAVLKMDGIESNFCTFFFEEIVACI